MLISQIIEQYLKDNPVYESLAFSVDAKKASEKLHPLFVMTQYIIDKYIESGNNNIAIVIPDDCNLFPLIVSKVISEISANKDSAENFFDNLRIGQHLRLGRAVIEFLGYANPEKTEIRYRYDRNSQATERSTIREYHRLFETTDAALTSSKIWNAERSRLDGYSRNNNLLFNRTAIRKATILLSTKYIFKDSLQGLQINNRNCEDVIAYGEVDLDNDNGFNLFNNGRLDCIPALAVVTETEEIYNLLNEHKTMNKVQTIVCMPDKFNELMFNPDMLITLMGSEIPLIVFMTEQDFHYGPQLIEYGFDIWHWKPSTLKTEAFLTDDSDTKRVTDSPIFGELTEKVYHATWASFEVKTICDTKMSDQVRNIYALSKTELGSEDLRQIVRYLWRFQKRLTRLTCKIIGRVRTDLYSELDNIKSLWNKQKKYYIGQEIDTSITATIEAFESAISTEISPKLSVLSEYAKKASHTCSRITVVLPDRDAAIAETKRALLCISDKIEVLALSRFYEITDRKYFETDVLIVAWFDKDEYIPLKQTYNYRTLVFVLFDYENKWRESFVRYFDECIPHDKIREEAWKLNISDQEIQSAPFDAVEAEIAYEDIELSDYHLPSNIMRSTLAASSNDSYHNTMINCIPVILSEDKIAHFYPSHAIIYVSADRGAQKKRAVNLRRGDRILIRQSEKDIIKEKADNLMAANGETELRHQVETWTELYCEYAQNKSISDVQNELKAAGCECTYQQIRYWLSGETILPRSKDVLIAISQVASCIDALCERAKLLYDNVDSIFSAGKRVQSYHQKAGRWLTNELKNKSTTIIEIAKSSNPHGVIDGIGEITIYTVEEILDNDEIPRNRINKVEDIYG